MNNRLIPVLLLLLLSVSVVYADTSYSAPTGATFGSSAAYQGIVGGNFSLNTSINEVRVERVAGIVSSTSYILDANATIISIAAYNASNISTHVINLTPGTYYIGDSNNGTGRTQREHLGYGGASSPVGSWVAAGFYCSNTGGTSCSGLLNNNKLFNIVGATFIVYDEPEPEPEPEYVEVVLTTANGTGNWTVPAGVTNVSVLVVGGGGGAGKGTTTTTNNGGGGGAGGLVFIEDYNVLGYGGTITFSVGSGGAGSSSTSNPGSAGGNTSFGNLLALGGGGGGSSDSTAAGRLGGNGGSGGGGGITGASLGVGGNSTQTTTNDGYAGTGFGNNGRTAANADPGAGGGGGAGGVGTPGTGGPGMTIWSVEYARGGDAESNNAAGANNTGSGGNSAARSSANNGGAGGSGIIVIRYTVNPVLTITANDGYNLSSIAEFSVNLTNETGTFSFSTTTGTITTDIDYTVAGFFNISVASEDYFTKTYADVNVSSGVFLADLVQAYASFECFQAYTSSSLACLQSGPLIRQAGTFTDQVNVTGYYPVNYTYSLSALDNETYSVEGFYNYQITLNASDYEGNPLTNFTISVESDLVSFNTTDNNTGVVVLELLRGYEYNVTITQNVPSGVDRNNSIETATFSDPFDYVGAYSESYQYNLTFPRLLVNIYDEQTSLLVMTNTTVTFTKGESSFTTSTTSGTLNFTGINAIESGVYSVLFENANYNPRTYSLTYNRTYAQTLNAYIAPEAAPSTIFTIEDRETRNPIEGATVTIQRHVNGTLTTVLSRSSDITGRVGFDYIPDRRYEFTITKNGYALKSFSLDPILFSSYTVLLDPERQFGSTGADFSVISIVILQDGFTELRPNDISLSFSDPAGGLVRYGYNVSTTATGLLGSANGTNAYGSILPLNFEIPDVTMWDQVRVAYYYELSDGSSGSYVRTYSIDQITKYANQTWVSNRQIAEEIPVLDRAGIVVIATGAMTALAYTFAGLGGAAVSALFILGFFTYSGFINGWVLAVSIIGFLLLLFGRGSQ